MIGALGAALVLVWLAGAFALGRPYFAGTDETAHLGYAQSVAHGTLPRIDDEPPVPDAADLWAIERSTAADQEHRTIWVANHPPLFYAAIAPGIWAANALDRDDGGLVVVRFANVLAAVVAVVLTFLFAREITGPSHVPVAAAGIVALIGLVPAATSIGLNDGAGLAAATGVLWCGARLLRRDPAERWSTPDRVLLGVTAVVAWGTRASTMLLAVAVAALLVVHVLTSPPDRRRPRLVDVFALGLLLPAVCFGWFYVRNIALYGDIGASSYLLERFDRVPEGSVGHVLTQGGLWYRVARGLTAPSTGRALMLPGLNFIVGAGLAGLLLALRGARRPGAPAQRPRMWVALLIAVGLAVPIVLTAQHVAGGGTSHSRYLLPLVPPAALLLAVGFDRIGGRLACAGLLAVLGWWIVGRLPDDGFRLAEERMRARTVPGMAALERVPGNDAWRAALVVIGLLGVVALAYGLLRPSGPSAEGS